MLAVAIERTHVTSRLNEKVLVICEYCSYTSIVTLCAFVSEKLLVSILIVAF
jgi:hypothetical protein